VTSAALDRPRSVFSLSAGGHCDRALAEALCTGRFIHAGVSREFGLEPDWPAPAPGDDWQQALAAFAWGLDLAHAFRETAEPRFLATWERLVLSWIERGQVERDAPDLTARRIEHWIYAWDALGCSAAFTGLPLGVPSRIVASLRTQLRHLHAHLAAQARPRPAEVYAILAAALAFPSLDTGRTLLTFASTALGEHLLEETLADGTHSSGDLAVHLEALRPLLGLRENARRFGLVLPAQYDTRLEQACEVVLHCHPSQPAADVPERPDTALLACAAELFTRGDLLWAASRGQRGVPPAQRNASFPLGGYHVQRSPWDSSGDRFCLFHLSPADATADAMRVEITAGGQAVVAKSGAGNDPAQEAAFHRGLVGRHSAPGLDLLHGHAFVPERDAWHDRQVIFVADEYWIIRDQLRDPAARQHELRFQLDPTAHGCTTVEAREDGTVIAMPGMAIVIAHGRGPLEIGLITAPGAPAVTGPLFSVVARGVTEHTLTTLVVPRAPGLGAPRLEVYDGHEATVIEVRGVGTDGQATDWIGWAREPAPLTLGEFRVLARLAWIRQSGDGKVLAFGASDDGAARTRVRPAPALVPELVELR